MVEQSLLSKGDKMQNHLPYTVLAIAGFDGSGGAGIQADLKTISALGCYAATVITAVVVQNTTGVKSIYGIGTKCLEEQIKVLLEDIPMNAIKIGMLDRHELIESVAAILREYHISNIVLDPVMTAKNGNRLLKSEAIFHLKKELFPITTVLTPNLSEASELLDRQIQDKDQMEKAALDLIQMGPQAIVVKGGHLNGDCDDCLCINPKSPKIYWLLNRRIETRNTHGTGCTFSSAIAAFLARGCTILDAVKRAKEYLTQAIDAGKQWKIGQGNGPVHHFWI